MQRLRQERLRDLRGCLNEEALLTMRNKWEKLETVVVDLDGHIHCDFMYILCLSWRHDRWFMVFDIPSAVYIARSTGVFICPIINSIFIPD